MRKGDDAKRAASGVPYYRLTRRSEMMTIAPPKIAAFNEEMAKDRFAENQERSTFVHESLEQQTIPLITNPLGSDQISCQGTGTIMDIVMHARCLAQFRQSPERHIRRLLRSKFLPHKEATRGVYHRLRVSVDRRVSQQRGTQFLTKTNLIHVRVRHVACTIG